MGIQTDFRLGLREDGTLTVGVVPATNISGWSLQYTQWKHFQNVSGSVSGLITKSAASGFNNVSGINVTNGAGGVFQVSLNRFDISGDFDQSAMYYRVERRDSGNATVISEGYRLTL